ncbi:MAG TPA: phosphodiester glycosidase family protein [Fimbriimonadaceae bacterium]|nr:phosphodiester glycosidase family protein [Fimbriimonadaceae bacterium]HRJ96026.1 phosphodiester glycosidase family protein [Fimbriimonadaceae bacterium]
MTAIILSLSLGLPSTPAPSGPVSYGMFKFGSGKYHMVTADLRSTAISPGAIHVQKLTSVWTMVEKEKPLAAITGTFFNPRSERPVADVVVDGKLVATGNRGSAVAVDWFGQVHILDTQFKKSIDWMSYRFLLRGAVRIVSRGAVAVNPQAQKFKDSRIWGRAARTAIGKGDDGRLVMVATNSSVTLSELGKALISQGVKEAISLDGGSSTCLYYRGSLVVPPKRKLSNLFVIRDKPAFDY